MNNTSDEKSKKTGNPTIAMALSFLGCFALAAVSGYNSESQPLSGALAGALFTALGAAASHFALLKLFPGLSPKKALNIISGILTLLLGLGLSALLWFLLGMEGARLWIFTAIVLLWTIHLIKDGLQTGSFPAALLGAILGGAFYYGATALIPSLYPSLEGAPSHASLAYVLVGAYSAFLGASSMRAGRFGFKEEQPQTESPEE